MRICGQIVREQEAPDLKELCDWLAMIARHAGNKVLRWFDAPGRGLYGHPRNGNRHSRPSRICIERLLANQDACARIWQEHAGVRNVSGNRNGFALGCELGKQKIGRRVLSRCQHDGFRYPGEPNSFGRQLVLTAVKGRKRVSAAPIGLCFPARIVSTPKQPDLGIGTEAPWGSVTCPLMDASAAIVGVLHEQTARSAPSKPKGWKLIQRSLVAAIVTFVAPADGLKPSTLVTRISNRCYDFLKCRGFKKFKSDSRRYAAPTAPSRQGNCRLYIPTAPTRNQAKGGARM